MNRILAALAVWIVATALVAQADPDEDYLSIYSLIQRGDREAERGETAEATSTYGKALSHLQLLKQTYPDWQSNVVNYRLKYLSQKLIELKTPADSTPSGPATTPAIAASASRLAENEAMQRELAALRAQLQQLQANNDSLQAKLREAFTMRPTDADPAALAKAEQQISQLVRQNELLKVSLEDAKAKASASVAGEQIEQLRKELEATNKRLQIEARRAMKLDREKADLENRVGKTVTSPRAGATYSSGQSDMSDLQMRLTAQQAVASQLLRDKKNLEARLTHLETEIANAAALRAENDMLRDQLAELKATTPVAGEAGELGARLAAAEAQIAALQSERDLLRLERAALEKRVVQLVSEGQSGSGRASAARRIEELEKQVEELQRQLTEANRLLANNASSQSAERTDALAAQLAAARAKLEVYESKPVPYTAEELALFRASSSALANTDQPVRKSSPRPPAGSATLIAEAQRHFMRGDYAQAEAQYQKVLRKDENNAYTLANLAAIQFEEDKLDEAEKNVRSALAIAPDDTFSLQTLGLIKFRQKDYDEALKQLSRAAQLDPSNAIIQNYLGLTLSFKGQRVAAETALRKALQLQPGYADAHNNLAVTYATQEPPMIELARWHYQKALAGGFPKNPRLEKILNERSSNKTP